MNSSMVFFLKMSAQPKEIRPGLISSIHAAYTKEEIVVILNKTPLKDAVVSKDMIGIEIKGIK